MKKIINGKLYNTETATCLGSWSNGHDVGDFTYCEESFIPDKVRQLLHFWSWRRKQ